MAGSFASLAGRRNGATASSAALLWLVGLYALPFLHNLDHRADHTHGREARGTEAHTRPHPHPHPHPQTHSHPDTHTETGHARTHEEAPEPVPIDSEHGSGSTLHFAGAKMETASLPALAIPTKVAPLAFPEPPQTSATPRIVVLARGPPVTD